MSSDYTAKIIPNDLAKKYPNIVAWVEDGTIEIGRRGWGGPDAFIMVHDEGGTVWEGKRTYATIDEALQEAERAIGEWIKKNS